MENTDWEAKASLVGLFDSSGRRLTSKETMKKAKKLMWKFTRPGSKEDYPFAIAHCKDESGNLFGYVDLHGEPDLEDDGADFYATLQSVGSVATQEYRCSLQEAMDDLEYHFIHGEWPTNLGFNSGGF